MFQPALRQEDLADNSVIGLVLAGWPVAIARINGALHAVIDRCSHQMAALSPGRIRRGMILCPLHGASFDPATGKCLGGAYPAIRTFPVRVAEGWIEVDIPSDPPPA
jgi:3-phenylpropionate/trans-cinnamate dioxygenase ferredoxin subunit